MYLSKNKKVIILVLTLVISIISTIFFVIKTVNKNSSVKKLIDNFEIKGEPLSDTKSNLTADFILNNFKVSELNKSLEIKPKLAFIENSANPTIIYEISFNKKLFEYYFLQQVIRFYPQWHKNVFCFYYNKNLQHAWVKYSTETSDNYLNWYFKIINKIE